MVSCHKHHEPRDKYQITIMPIIVGGEAPSIVAIVSEAYGCCMQYFLSTQDDCWSYRYRPRVRQNTGELCYQESHDIASIDEQLRI